jgi:hypothetical protein
VGLLNQWGLNAYALRFRRRNIGAGAGGLADFGQRASHGDKRRIKIAELALNSLFWPSVLTDATWSGHYRTDSMRSTLLPVDAVSPRPAKAMKLVRNRRGQD